MFQDYARYHLTVRENIWFGDARRPPDDARIRRAAHAAAADDAIQRLGRGYDTMLGRLFTEGEELSIGEWQKIALARAFLRDAEILIVDEPTSVLDAEAEAAVFASVRALLHHRAAVVISHRFSTVRLADCIYVLEQGRVTECGDHDDLMRLGGRYAHMFSVQAAPYKD